MGLNPNTLPDNILCSMTGKDRKKIGRITRAEALGKLQRGEELIIHKQLVGFLQRNDLYYRHSATHKKHTERPGTPDFMVRYGERCVEIELKSEKGMLSDDQEENIELARKNGFEVHICRTYESARDLIIRELRIPREKCSK